MSTRAAFVFADNPTATFGDGEGYCVYVMTATPKARLSIWPAA